MINLATPVFTISFPADGMISIRIPKALAKDLEELSTLMPMQVSRNRFVVTLLIEAVKDLKASRDEQMKATAAVAVAAAAPSSIGADTDTATRKDASARLAKTAKSASRAYRNRNKRRMGEGRRK